MKHVALITGASRGIGRATADRLVERGYKVIGIARRVPVAEFPGKFVELDLSDCDKSAEVFATLSAEEHIDVLVNNVGLVQPEPLGGISEAVLQMVLDLNLRPALQAVQSVLPNMRARKWGRIVNISSLTVLGARERTCYAAAKSALISFTRSWALELAAAGITVNCVAPGATDTELFRENNPPGSQAEERLIRATPMGRIGQPDEIASAVAYFLSEDASFVTGQTLFVDGGLSLGRVAF
jgi:3-oxoacyl-[acyl-carrier protein] reductase